MAAIGRRGGLLTYTEFLQGVLFQLPNVGGGEPFHIDLPEGRELDRAILGAPRRS